jgi:hypothetical protein
MAALRRESPRRWARARAKEQRRRAASEAAAEMRRQQEAEEHAAGGAAEGAAPWIWSGQAEGGAASAISTDIGGAAAGGDSGGATFSTSPRPLRVSGLEACARLCYRLPHCLRGTFLAGEVPTHSTAGIPVCDLA